MTDGGVQQVLVEAQRLASELGIPVDLFLRDCIRAHVENLKWESAYRLLERGEPIYLPTDLPVLTVNVKLNRHTGWTIPEGWVRKDPRFQVPKKDAAPQEPH